jgi:N-formylmaleamate deformylase
MMMTSSQILPTFPLPTLLIVAGKGGTVLPEDVSEMKMLLPTMNVSYVPTAGHMIPWDDLEDFFGAFGDFLGHPLIHISRKATN